jgi:hypothetical protein
MIIDVDTHLTDASDEMWRPYFRGADAEHAPRVVTEAGTQRLYVGGLLLPKPAGPGTGSPLGIGATTHQDGLTERLEFMSRLNITRAFLLPGFVGLTAHMVSDPAVARALAHAHNEVVHGLSQQAGQLVFAPVVLPDDPDWSVAQLRRWQQSNPLTAVVSRPTTKQVRPYADAAKNPLLRYLLDEGIVLMLHGATGYHQASPMADLFDDYRWTHVFSHPFEHMTALADLIGTGVMSDGLKVGVIEAGCGWVPWFLDRLQDHFTHTGGCQPVNIDVHALVHERLLLGIEPADSGVPGMLTADLGDILAFGSDFPHWDAAKPDDVAGLVDRYGPDVSHRILYQNAHDFYQR